MEPSLFDRFLLSVPAQAYPLHIWLYRATGGLIVDRLTWGAPALLLTTIGRLTGLNRTVTVGHLKRCNDVIVVGTNAGRSKSPAWVSNLQAYPHANIQLRRDHFPAIAEFLGDSDRQQYWNQLVKSYPTYEYASQQSGRDYPIIRMVKGAAL